MNSTGKHVAVSQFGSSTRAREACGEDAYISPRTQSPERREAGVHDGESALFEASDGLGVSQRLLIGPPRTRWSNVGYKLAVTGRRFGNVPGLNQDLVYSAVQTGIFIVKLTSLLRPCWPYVPSVEVGLPLVIVAAIELRQPSMAAGSLIVGQERNRHSTGPRFTSHPLSLVATIVLLGFHFGILWIASRWEVLCFKSSVSGWAEWN